MIAAPFARRPGFFGLVASDVHAKARWLYGDETARSVCKAWFTDGTFAMLVYRLMQASRRLHLAPFVMLFNKCNVWFGGCIIGRNADFGPGFVLIHSHGVVINSAVRGGRDVKLEHQVTLGADEGVSPTLGDDVFVGAGARILGAVKIGSHVKVGANAVVLTDIPDGATAVGVPARVVKSNAGAGGG